MQNARRTGHPVWLRPAAVIAMCWTAATATAAGADLSGADLCISNAVSSAQNPADCLTALHAPCLAFPASSTPQATLCFHETAQQWDGLIRGKLADLKAAGDPEIVAVAAIESRYDLLSNQLQCDRLDELSALYKQPDDARLLQKTRCEAAAAGLTYIRLMLRSGPAQ